ncbi:DUF4367 domain-containing protein [Candidatus Saccharibacteria bacterium]|nr:DUF4367 domain-containing protein [Candidatus Saccharibacteria bacterium]MCL1962743.1 DUF4367 domain-containing protein [Candidatus Saccharibacteria bacterium]
MGVVVINGKGYDSQTGLPMEQTLSFAVERSVKEKVATVASRKKTRRTSKQERLAAAVAREFEDDAVAVREIAIERGEVREPETTVAASWVERFLSGEEAEFAPVELKYATPEWTHEHVIGKQFETVRKVEVAAPSWISNYLDGNDPIEIEPIIEEFISDPEPAQPEVQGWIQSYLDGETPIEAVEVGLGDHRKSVEIMQKYSRDFAPTRLEPHSIGRAPERSETLNRDFVKKPIDTEKVNVVRKHAQVATHPDVFRFDRAPIIHEITAPDPVKLPQSVEDKLLSEYLNAPFQPIAQKSPVVEQAPAAVEQPSSDAIKNALINEQIVAPVDFKSRRRAEKEADKKYGKRRFFRAPTIITAALAVVVLGGYFTYINMPAISIRVAANQAGIDAHVPYTANGYSIDGPVAYAAGQIRINYKSNGDAAGYSVVQQESDWSDSDIVRGLVRGEKYDMMNAGGTTVYVYGNNASWIKGNILYTVNGNELLGSDQIMKIAESV